LAQQNLTPLKKFNLKRAEARFKLKKILNNTANGIINKKILFITLFSLFFVVYFIFI